MELSEANILFFTRTMNLGGTENVVLQLCEIFKPIVNKIVVCSCGGVNTEKLSAMHIKHYRIPDIKKKSPDTILKTFLKVKRIIRKEKINVIHTHHRMAGLYTRLLTCCNKSIVFFNTSHNTFTDKIWLTRFAYRKAHLIACGSMVQKNLNEIYGLSDVKVIHNAVKPYNQPVEIIPQLQELKEKGFVLVGNVGRLSEQKGMKYFIKSFPKVKRKCHNVKYIIVGDGEDKEKLLKLRDKFCKEDDIIFLGYRNDIQNVISQLDFIVLSSLWEGLPLTPIEAFSVGKTVIGTAVDGTVEIIEDGKNGLLIPARSSGKIAEKVVFLAENTDIRTEFEQNAKKTYNESFSFKRLSESYIQYYKECLSDVKS